jgi:hypothetical protein
MGRNIQREQLTTGAAGKIEPLGIGRIIASPMLK